jgi:DNA gyrase inhibitor GyrI
MELGIRIVEMPPMRVACYRAESESPELDALKKLRTWAEQKGFIGPNTRTFGFDNPGPSNERAEYGYEVWMTVGKDAKDSSDVRIKEIAGGIYAVTRTDLPHIGETWKRLVKWCKAESYPFAEGQCLEEHLSHPVDVDDGPVMLDLYLPIEK